MEILTIGFTADELKAFPEEFAPRELYFADLPVEKPVLIHYRVWIEWQTLPQEKNPLDPISNSHDYLSCIVLYTPKGDTSKLPVGYYVTVREGEWNEIKHYFSCPRTCTMGTWVAEMEDEHLQLAKEAFNSGTPAEARLAFIYAIGDSDETCIEAADHLLVCPDCLEEVRRELS